MIPAEGGSRQFFSLWIEARNSRDYDDLRDFGECTDARDLSLAIDDPLPEGGEAIELEPG